MKSLSCYILKFKNRHSRAQKYHQKKKLPNIISYLDRLGLAMTSVDAYETLKNELQIAKQHLYNL